PFARTRRLGTDLLIICLLANIALLVPLIAGLALLNYWREWPFRTSQLRYMWLVPFGIFAGGLYQSAAAWATRERNYQILAVTRVWQSVGQVVSQLALGAISSSPFGLLLGDGLSRGVGFLQILRQTLLGCDVKIVVKWKRIITAALAYRRFPLI